MHDFDAIFAMAAKRKGGAAALESLLVKPMPAAALAKVGDDRWLAAMAKAIFQAGFNWQVVDHMWPGFEDAFAHFDPRRVAMYHEDDLNRLLGDKRVVRNGPKLRAVMENARFIVELAGEHGSAARFFANWPAQNLSGLVEIMEKRGSRLGGITAQRVLRAMGRDAYILTPDVVARLIAEGVVKKQPSSRRDREAVQQAFNAWAEQSGRSFTEISRVLAMSIGDNRPIPERGASAGFDDS
ncbi:MAG TPA: DNA-3-methyladenine glycosylase I [Aestuariivirga sp.]|nr:DNA-3-methyladenine glycosylase I [Aestuariivirga sp.]